MVDVGGSRNRKGNCIQAKGETSCILFGFQHWRRGTVSVSNVISLTMYYDKVYWITRTFS